MSFPPSMVHKSGNRLVVRSVVSGDKLYGTSETEEETVVCPETNATAIDANIERPPPDESIVAEQDEELPQCKVKRNYACSSCSYYTQNPRYYLHHLRNVHKEKIRIYECPHCLYASKHSQKLQRHIHMVHVMGKRKMLIKAKTSTPPKISPPPPPPRISTSVLSALMKQEDSPSNHKETVKEDPPESPVDDAVTPTDETRVDRTTEPTEVEENHSPDEQPDQADQPLKCSLCSFSSRNPNLVTRHERLVHLKKKFYRCTKCDYITHMKARFTKHVKYHSMPMIKCEMCDFRTPYKWNLDRHNKNHFANGAFKCSQCNFTADIKQSLTVHEMNHHVPPVNQNGSGGGLGMLTPAKRRCRVGASDIIGQQQQQQQEIPSSAESDFDDLELLRMERESLPPLSADSNVGVAVTSDEVAQMAAVEISMVKPNVPGPNKALNVKNPTAAAYLNGTLKPEDVILTKNGSVYVKKFRCRVCQYKAAWESEMIRHEVRVHGLEVAPKKKPIPRPIPNLIPIQNNNNASGNGSCSAGNSANKSNPNKSQESSPIKNGLFSSAVPFADSEFDKPLTEKDLNDIYAKSCATSSLKDFASLISAEETTKSDRLKDFVSMLADSECKVDKADASKITTAKNETSEGASEESKKVPDSFKRKNATFFDRLKEKLMGGAGETGNLVCWCGHQSKCLSESVLHQKAHSETVNEKVEKSSLNGPLISGAELSSTRCQHCRQRCKTSTDLFVHLQSCPEMNKKAGIDENSAETSLNNEFVETNNVEVEQVIEDPEIEDETRENHKFSENAEIEKGENRVFVWNSFCTDKEEGDEFLDDECRSKSPASESSLVGYEIAPGIGSVIPSSNEDVGDNYKFNNSNIDFSNTEGTAKKVFKCPTCTFWASTASRFHVHIVSHMNVKPFGCSVCPYQSKWKWDVTKHIKLKKERDPSHERAEMRTIDVETGRRNYTKYNRFLTVMRVHEPQPESKLQPLPVPILPKLTPAPTINGDIEKGSHVSTDTPMRPLPQLHPADPTVPMKRSHEPGDDSEIPRKKVPSEKKMWKCKKCKFRNTDRNIVLAHVKEHYANGMQNSNDSNKLNRESDIYNAYSHEFRKMTENQENRNGMVQSGLNVGNEQNRTPDNGNFKCDVCNFETSCSSTFRFHSRHHVENPSAPYKCCFCPFFADDKQFMLDHVSSHGISNAEESLSMIMNNNSISKGEDLPESGVTDEGNINDTDRNVNRSEPGAGEEMEIFKRFKCGACPYVTNNKSQYLYHKQFHRLRNAPFKCNICSYNVTKRHLLHQHLKIHGVKRAQFKNCMKDAVEKESPDSTFTLNTDIETSHLPDIPLVWVHKAGALTKMFKCRHCPHVNLRKSNIHEHEKMHFDRIQRSPNGSITSTQTTVHRCTECNYVCNNAGALASHFKVHQGAFGQICALADPRRSDELQIREITRLLREDDRFRNASAKSNENQENGKKIMATTMDVPSGATRSGILDGCSSDLALNSTADSAACIDGRPVLFFCNVCPARFLCQKDLESHMRFHSAHHLYKCNSCTYSAPQQAQLLAHKRVHTNEYQEKTNQMTASYEISKEYPRSKTTLILDKPGFAGLGWVVVHTSQKKAEEVGTTGKTKVVTKQFSCHKCPAQFFKSVALQHHLTLHGGKDQFECRSCDYRVKTYGNLIKHESVHGLEPRQKAKGMKNKKIISNGGIPCSGTELFQHRSEQIIKEQTTQVPAAPLSVDPEFGILIHGSPDFIYPTTLKNGRMKEKRYKCHKCPSAFEKREQYKTHVSLHGAKSRFRCEKCDYSVKYYANYTQHMRKHDLSEKCQSERRASVISKASEESSYENVLDVSSNSATMIDDVSCPSASMSPEKNLFVGPSPNKAAKTLHISVADQQAVVLMQQKLTVNGVNVADHLHRCHYCPYSHQRRDAVENHERCHFSPKGNYVCEFCNYTVQQSHFLREHQKLHFGPMKGIKPEAFMKCDRLEIWMETEEGKVLIFKDNGTSVNEENRFEPPVKVNEDESEFKKMYVDVKTGEECTPLKEESNVDACDKNVNDTCKNLSRFGLTEERESDASSVASDDWKPTHNTVNSNTANFENKKKGKVRRRPSNTSLSRSKENHNNTDEFELKKDCGAEELSDTSSVASNDPKETVNEIDNFVMKKEPVLPDEELSCASFEESVTLRLAEAKENDVEGNELEIKNEPELEDEELLEMADEEKDECEILDEFEGSSVAEEAVGSPEGEDMSVDLDSDAEFTDIEMEPTIVAQKDDDAAVDDFSDAIDKLDDAELTTENSLEVNKGKENILGEDSDTNDSESSSSSSSTCSASSCSSSSSSDVTTDDGTKEQEENPEWAEDVSAKAAGKDPMAVTERPQKD